MVHYVTVAVDKDMEKDQSLNALILCKEEFGRIAWLT